MSQTFMANFTPTVGFCSLLSFLALSTFRTYFYRPLSFSRLENALVYGSEANEPDSTHPIRTQHLDINLLQEKVFLENPGLLFSFFAGCKTVTQPR
jgi:hypothetical protein